MEIEETGQNQTSKCGERPCKKDIIASSEYIGELVQKLNLTDDVFFAEVMRNAAACEYLMSMIISKEIKIKRLKDKPQNFVQYAIRNIEGHSVCLDVYAEDANGKICNIEMQKTNKDDIVRRLRMNGSLMDCRILERGTMYSELPETYLLCITGYCPFDTKEVKHEIKSFVNGDPDHPYDNGIHIIYVNTVYSDESELSKLMAYLKDSRPDVHDFGALSDIVTKIKKPVKGEGEYIMSEEFIKTVESIYTRTCADVREADRAKGREEGIQVGREEGIQVGREEGIQVGSIKKAVTMINNLLKIGTLSFEEILNAAGISKETYERYKDAY